MVACGDSEIHRGAMGEIRFADETFAHGKCEIFPSGKWILI